jgi:hypothetical protein
LSCAVVPPNRGKGLLLQLLVNTGDERSLPHLGNYQGVRRVDHHYPAPVPGEDLRCPRVRRGVMPMQFVSEET